MKKLALLVLVLSLVGLPVALIRGQTTPPAGSGSTVKKEQHPAIRAAIRSLQAAKAHLEQANHDFGGHRVTAIKACDEALAQLNQALQFDKN